MKQQTLEDIKKMLKIRLNYSNILFKDHLKSVDPFAQYSHLQKKCFVSFRWLRIEWVPLCKVKATTHLHGQRNKRTIISTQLRQNKTCSDAFNLRYHKTVFSRIKIILRILVTCLAKFSVLSLQKYKNFNI